MTDNEIIKALNYCCGNVENNDEECNKDMCYQVILPESRDECARWCRQWLIKDALDLINRQKAEIINRTEEYNDMLEQRNKCETEIERLEKELTEYKLRLKMSNNITDEIKSEAIKEFARELKCGVPQERGVIRYADIDNLVKEMTEAEE